MMKFALEDLRLMMLTRKFWLYQTNIILNHLIRQLRDCLLFVQEYSRICMTSLASNRFIYIELHIFRQMVYAKNKTSTQELFCHSCMLLDMVAGIILWLVTSHVFSSIYHHAVYGLC
jgi:hypothetical protein